MSEPRTRTLHCDRCGQTAFQALPHANGTVSWVCPGCGGFYKSPEAKAMLQKQAEESFERAVHEGDSVEDLTRKLDRTLYEGEGVLPTELRGADGIARGLPTILSPDGKDMRDFARASEVCGHCKYFDLESGRREVVRQQLAKVLAQDYEWQMRHLGAPADQLALCGASGGHTMVAFVSKSCDQFRQRSGR